MVSPNPNYIRQIENIIQFQILSDLKDVDEFISNLRDIAKIRNKGVIPIMKKIYHNKTKWEIINYFDKAICLDFLIDEYRHSPKEKKQDEVEVKSMIEELIQIAEKNVSVDDVVEDPIGIAVIKRCLVEPSEYFPPKIGFYINFTEDLLGNSSWGRQIISKARHFKYGLKYIKK